MQRKTGTEVELGKAVSLFDSIGASSAIDRSASNYLNAAEKEQKIRKLISAGTYDADIVKYIPGMLENIDTKEQPAYVLYRDMENLDFK